MGMNFPSVSYMFRGQECPNAFIESGKILNLFNDFRVDETFAVKTCDIINNILCRQ